MDERRDIPDDAPASGQAPPPASGQAPPLASGEAPPPASSGAPARARHRRRRRWLIVILIAIIAVLGYFAYRYIYLRGYVSTDDAFVDAHDFVISAKILARIDSLLAAEGDTVTAGELLVVLNTRELEAELAQARTDVDVARQSITLEGANVALAEDDFQRVKVQYQHSVVTKERYDHAQKTLEMARARLAVAEAQLQAAKARVDVVQTQIDQTRIVSPTWGVVARKWVVPGDVVQAGASIFTLYNLRDVWITANLEETKIKALRVGDPARVSLDAYSRTFNGQVSLIGAAAASEFALIPPNNASGNFTKVTQRIPIRIRLEHSESHSSPAEPGLLPGMSATVRIDTRGAH